MEATRLGENISLVKLTQVLCCQGYRPRRCSKRQGCGQEASIPQHMTAEVKSQQGSCFLQSQEKPTLHKSSLESHMASLCLYSHVLQESSGLKRWLSDYELTLQRAALAEGRSLIPSFHIKEPTATCNSRSRDVQNLWPPWVPSFTCTNPQTDHIHTHN